MIAEHLKYAGDLSILAHSIPHKQKLMWLYRIEQLNKAQSEGSSTPYSDSYSELAWEQTMAHSMIPRNQ